MFLLIDKPKKVTSHDVVNKLRNITGVSRIGHAGTLDPNATGLLIVGIGRDSTRLLWTKFGKLDKTYLAEITLGEERETDDIDGKVLNTKLRLNNNISEYKIKKILNMFVGEQMQTPPFYSAIKSNGKIAYEEARKGNNLKLKARKIEIFSIKLLRYKFPNVQVEIKVSSGTYVRAFARDFGRKLGCGGYLSELKRIKIGKYKLKDALNLNGIKPENINNFKQNIFN